MAGRTAVLVGCGVHANTVLLPCLQYADVHVATVVDPDLDAARRIALKSGAVPLADLGEALARRHDFAVVATPMHEQGSVVRTLVEAGLPVFCEKPGGHSADDIERTRVHAQQRGVAVQVGFMRRYAPSYRAARHAVRRDSSLAIQLALAAGPAADRRSHAHDVGVHLFDLARFLIGEVELVSAVDRAATVDHATGERGAWQALLAGPRGSVSVCLSDQGSWGVPSERAWISGAGVTVLVTDYLTVSVSRAGRVEMADDRPVRFAEVSSQVLSPNFSSPRLLNNSLYLQGYLGEIDAFLGSLTMGTPPSPNLHDAREASRLVENIVTAVKLETSHAGDHR